MRITWYGHAAFLIETAGRRIVMDPYSPSSGYDPIADHADLVTVSHDNEMTYHSAADEVLGDPEVIHGLELCQGRPIQRDGVRLSAHKVYENAQGEGPNTMIRLEAEGLSVVHMGDVGHALDQKALGFLDGTDILLALAGGAPIIALDDLKAVIKVVRPPIVIPMHFGTDKVAMSLLPVEEVIKLFPANAVSLRDQPSLQVDPAGLPSAPTLIVLPFAR